MAAGDREEQEWRKRRRLVFWPLLFFVVLVGAMLPRALARGEPPPTPTITGAPAAVATKTVAVFAFTGAEPFECALDDTAFVPCSSPVRYQGLDSGRHVFLVRSRDGDGAARAAVHHWRIGAAPIPSSRPTQTAPRPAAPSPDIPPLPGTTVPVAETDGTFSIRGTPAGPLAPGVARPLPLVVTNPNDFAIEVTSLTVTVAGGSSRPDCDGRVNVAVRQAGDGGSIRLTVSGGGSVQLPAQGVAAPIVRMRDLPSNQDSCKAARFSLLLDGAAVEAQP